MIEPERALRDVRAKLRADVLPEVVSTHARAVLGAALGILDELAGRVVLDPRPAATTVGDLLPALERWERELAARAPAAAAELARARRAAAVRADVIAARVVALDATTVTVRAAWAELEPDDRDRVLADARRLLRADAERHGGADA